MEKLSEKYQTLKDLLSQAEEILNEINTKKLEECMDTAMYLKELESTISNINYEIQNIL